MKVKLGHEEMQYARHVDPAKAEEMVAWINAAGWDATTVYSMTFDQSAVLVEHLCLACEFADKNRDGKVHADPLDPTSVHTYMVLRTAPATPPPWWPGQLIRWPSAVAA